MGESEDLEKISLRNSSGSYTDVKIGDPVSLFDPETISNATERSSQKYMNKIIIEKIGQPPYKLSKITRTGVRTLLDVNGEKGIYKDITREYFGAVNTN